jgi:leucyl aminopeptidase
MTTTSSPVAFFDIGQTIGTPRLSADFGLVGLDVYPFVPIVLESLRSEGIRLGIISNTGSETWATLERVLTEAGIYEFFRDTPDLLIYSSLVGLKKDSPEIFSLAVGRAGHRDDPSRCIYIGEDRNERYFALQAGLRIAPHPNLALEVIHGETLRYVRIKPSADADRSWRTGLSGLPIVPLAVSGGGSTNILAITSSRTAARLDDLGFEIDRLGGDDLPTATELYLVRDDRQARTGFMDPGGQSAQYFGGGKPASWVLSSVREGLVLALPAFRSVEEVHFEEAGHGHNSKFLPDLSLLTPFGVGEGYRSASWLAQRSSWLDLSDADLPLDPEVLAALGRITPDSVRPYIDRYTGRSPLLGETEKITSRHIHSRDNFRAVRSLLKEFEPLSAAGVTARAIPFTHEGKTYYNVEAELPGRNADHPSELEREIVIIGAHLDSTAAFSDHPYNPQTDPAPGADDDASGVAAVLALAKVLSELPTDSRPARTLRFLLFNAEEHGLVGSRAYARDQAATGVPIVAVFQMDMIGFVGENDALPRPYEVHAGFPDDADVEQRSVVLAERVKRLAPLVATRDDGAVGLQDAQVYVQADPAAGRSDHASFQERGYAACVISEDFFIGPDATSPTPQANQNYHKDTDAEVNLDYLVDVAGLPPIYVPRAMRESGCLDPTPLALRSGGAC